MSMNLRRFQWQIGNVVLGPGTQYEVFGPKIQSYNVNAQDSQIALSDETNMGQDTFQGQPLQFKFGVKDNAPNRYMAHSLPADMEERAALLLETLQDEWKANQVKQSWGAYVPLTYCDGYGVVKQIWGRPGKFEYTAKTQTSQFRIVNAEFRRRDTYCYSERELAVELVEGADPVVYTIGGRADTWFRVLFYGPQSDPHVIVGNNDIQLGMDIPAGLQVEVSSYPWLRRVMDSNNVVWRNKLIGNTKYLNQLQLPKQTPLQMSWSADNTAQGSRCLVLWRDAYNII